MDTQLAIPFPPSKESETTFINGRCLLRKEGDQRVVIVAGLPIHSFSVGDAVAQAYVMVSLVDTGFAQQNEVAKAFGCATRTVRRYQQRYALGGMSALSTRSGWRPGRRRIKPKRVRFLDKLNKEGVSNREIARRLGVTEKAIRKQVGPQKESAQQQVIPFPIAQDPITSISEQHSTSPSQKCEAPIPVSVQINDLKEEADEVTPISLDTNPADRTLDRLSACFGFLDDALPVFGDARAVPGAGVLFALPCLKGSGIFEVARKVYGSIGPAFYGLRTTVLTLLLMTLMRIKRPEWLKERDPAALGRVLGLDRAPEVKTLRRKLTRLASYHLSERLGAELAKRRVAERGKTMGFLYVDGHVRVYHGKRKIPKAYATCKRLALPATTDYWINDQKGDPLFVVTAEANAGMVKMLPEVAREIRKLVGERRVTIVFDRGGWSPKLFRKLIQEGFDILTYRKGKRFGISEKRFVIRRAKLDGRWVKYRLHDQAVRFLKGKLRLRQITRLTDDSHQTQIITSRWDLKDIVIAYRMFERWRQENFFKYMNEEFLLDALVDYQVEPDDPTRTVPNPKRRALDKRIRTVRTEIAKIEQAYGAAAFENTESERPTMRGFKITLGKMGEKLRTAKQQLASLMAKRRKLPQRVEVRDTSDDTVIKLATERKHLTNIIKMVAYQAESDLFALLRPHYARADEEGRTLLHELFAAPADSAVINNELHITLAPLSSPHRTRAIQAICESLNHSETPFPGTNLRLCFFVSAPRQLGMAFPGPAL